MKRKKFSTHQQWDEKNERNEKKKKKVTDVCYLSMMKNPLEFREREKKRKETNIGFIGNQEENQKCMEHS